MKTTEFSPRSVPAADNLAAACVQFLQACAARGLRPNTLTAYRYDLEQFAGFMLERGIERMNNIRAADVEDWLQALVQGAGNSRRTAQRKLAAARALFRWAMTHRGVLRNPATEAAPLRVTIDRQVAPEARTIRRLLDSIDTSTVLGVRDRALFELLADSALRVDGLVSLDVYDPNDPPRWCVRPNGLVTYRNKGGRTGETVASAPSTLRWLARWLEVRDGQLQRAPCRAQFVVAGRRLGSAAIRVRLKHYGAAVGAPDIHPHLLRHRRVGDVLEAGDLHTAQYLAGHASKRTTADMYGDQSNEERRLRIVRDCPFDGGAPCDA